MTAHIHFALIGGIPEEGKEGGREGGGERGERESEGGREKLRKREGGKGLCKTDTNGTFAFTTFRLSKLSRLHQTQH